MVGVWQGVGRIDRCLTVQSHCRERAGLDFDLLGYPSRPAAQAPPFPHHQYSHHHNDQHISTMNVHCSHSHSDSSSSQVLPYSRYRFSHASLPLAIAISPASLSATESTTSDSSYSVYGKTPPGGDREKDRGRNQGKPTGARALVDCAI